MADYIYGIVSGSQNLSASLTKDEFLYGKLNNVEILKEYVGLNTDTAQTIIDNFNSTISVNVIKIPHKLTVQEATTTYNFDATQDILIDLTPYQKKAESFNTCQLVNNELIFYKQDGTELTRVELSPFVQEQSDLSETDSTKETFIKSKSTKYLENTGDGSDNNSPYATQAWVGRQVTPHYSGTINRSDWTVITPGSYYSYTIAASTHGLTNPYCVSYLVQYDTNQEGLESSMYSYVLLPNGSVKFYSSIDISQETDVDMTVSYRLEGDN